MTSLPSPLNQVAIVLDGVVQSAPTINEAIDGGQAQITGGSASSPFTQTETDRAGPGPELRLAADRAQAADRPGWSRRPWAPTSSRAGLIAGAIDLGLVILFLPALLPRPRPGQRRVAAASLPPSPTPTVIVLGHAIGYRLSLAGIAGFIVAVGITTRTRSSSTSNDYATEVREGRTAAQRCRTGVGQGPAHDHLGRLGLP